MPVCVSVCLSVCMYACVLVHVFCTLCVYADMCVCVRMWHLSLCVCVATCPHVVVQVRAYIAGQGTHNIFLSLCGSQGTLNPTPSSRRDSLSFENPWQSEPACRDEGSERQHKAKYTHESNNLPRRCGGKPGFGRSAPEGSST